MTGLSSSSTLCNVHWCIYTNVQSLSNTGLLDIYQDKYIPTLYFEIPSPLMIIILKFNKVFLVLPHLEDSFGDASTQELDTVL